MKKQLSITKHFRKVSKKKDKTWRQIRRNKVNTGNRRKLLKIPGNILTDEMILYPWNKQVAWKETKRIRKKISELKIWEEIKNRRVGEDQTTEIEKEG